MKNKKVALILIILCIMCSIIYVNKFKNDTEYTFNSNIEAYEFDKEYSIFKININISMPIIKFANKFKEKYDLLNINIAQNEPNNNKLININLANKETLKSLPSIGDILAENIIKYRDENGNFKNIEEIKNVSRIGEKIFQKIKHLITI